MDRGSLVLGGVGLALAATGGVALARRNMGSMADDDEVSVRPASDATFPVIGNAILDRPHAPRCLGSDSLSSGVPCRQRAAGTRDQSLEQILLRCVAGQGSGRAVVVHRLRHHAQRPQCISCGRADPDAHASSASLAPMADPDLGRTLAMEQDNASIRRSGYARQSRSADLR